MCCYPRCPNSLAAANQPAILRGLPEFNLREDAVVCRRPIMWHFPSLDPYRLLRPFFFRHDPEKAHTLTLTLLEKGLGPKEKAEDDPVLHTQVCGLAFRNPIGLAAGFDKNARAINELLAFGFGSIEVGTITPAAAARVITSLAFSAHPRPKPSSTALASTATA